MKRFEKGSTWHPIMIAVIDGQPVGCRNSCFPSIQNSTRSRSQDLQSSAITELRSGGLQITPEHRSLPRLNTKANHAETLKTAARSRPPAV